MENRTAANREELQALIEAMRAENAALKTQLAALVARIKQLEAENLRLRQGGGGTPLAIKPSRKPREKKKRKHRQQSFVRRREETPDEVRYHAAERCPDCGRKLSGGWEHRRRQTIEVILQQQVVEHVLWARWCGVCRKRAVPEAAVSEFQAQGKRRFGASVQAVVALLHIAGRIPIRMVKRMLQEVCGVHISEGAVVALLDGAKQAGEAELEELLEQVRGSPAVCGDETGWREDGENGYLWGFFTPTVRYFVYRRSRGGQVPVEVLGEDFGGVVTCDFYGGYNRLDALQRCWVHLLGDAKELAEINADRPEVGAWVASLQELYREATAFSFTPSGVEGHPRARVRRQARKDFERRAKALAEPYAADESAPQRVLANRILKHLSELFVFVTNPAVPAENNLAERSLRPAVIARKISGGTRSEKGSETRMGLMSLFGTWAAQKKNLLASCQNLLIPSLAGTK